VCRRLTFTTPLAPASGDGHHPDELGCATAAVVRGGHRPVRLRSSSVMPPRTRAPVCGEREFQARASHRAGCAYDLGLGYLRQGVPSSHRQERTSSGDRKQEVRVGLPACGRPAPAGGLAVGGEVICWPAGGTVGPFTGRSQCKPPGIGPTPRASSWTRACPPRRRGAITWSNHVGAVLPVVGVVLRVRPPAGPTRPATGCPAWRTHGAGVSSPCTRTGRGGRPPRGW
jgi:hypothetical protein